MKRRRCKSLDSKIDAMPTALELQAAVRDAYSDVKSVYSKYHGNEIGRVPIDAMRSANACLIGAILFDTVCGRVTDWEQLTFDNVKSQIDAGHDYIICRSGKTTAHSDGACV